MGEVLELGILGPLDVRVQGGSAAMGGLRQKALLAVLALHANEVVSTDRLVDDLWGESAPATAVHTVQVFVSRLRRALLGAGDRLVTSSPGYVLELAADELDAARCERLYEAARSDLSSGNPADAGNLLDEALRMWRGPPLVDFTYEPFAQATIARLEELRLSCREELVEAELALARHARVVSELEELVREQPFRERPRAQLMLALYRSGRQADALEEFQRARRMLVDELGVEPGRALRELEQAILRHDESLWPPTAARAAVADSRAPARPDVTGKQATSTGADASVPGAASVEAMVRKTATILVVRLSSRGHVDPETSRRSMSEARELVDRIVARHGGAPVGALGNELVWVFGVPLVREDDALRALRAADELRTQLTDAGGARASQLAVRAGVATGEVLAESPSAVFGDPLNRGLSFTQAAGDGEVLLSDSTRRLAAAAIRTEPALADGAWRLVGLVTPAPQPVAEESPMVGRADELAGALEAFRRAARSRETHLLTVVGDAGIGKSRLARELAARLGAEANVVVGRCLSYGEGIAFWPLREALAQAAGDESVEAIRGLVGEGPDADAVADNVAAALGLGPAEGVSELVPWAFRRLLNGLATPGPLVLVIEDAHWAEQPLLDLVDDLVDWLRAPVLIVCLARPELLEVRPDWGGGRARVSSIVLVRLDEDDALDLLNQQLRDRQLSDSERAQILQTAEGNPLFVEQLLRMRTEDPGWDREREIPATIQALLAARLDRLGPGERAFLERAALIGREFWSAAVHELLPPDARPSAPQHLRALVHRGLIQPDRSTRAGEDRLRFHHILIRDIAYRSTSKELRADLHERLGGWLANRGETSDEFIGHHLSQAFHYRSELGRVDAADREVAASASEHLAAAGRRASWRGDANAAARLLTRAAELLEAAQRERPDVLVDLGAALWECGKLRGAERSLRLALEQARSAGADAVAARASIELSELSGVVDPQARVEDTMVVAKEAIAVFERVGDEGGLSRAWLHVADAHWTRCRFAEMERVLEQALSHAERAGVRREKSRILGGLARAYVMGPRHVDDAVARCEGILGRAEDEIILTVLANTMLAVLDAMRGRDVEARERWRQCERRLESVGLSGSIAPLHMYRALIELMSEHPMNVEPELEATCAALEEEGERSRRATLAALLARLLYRGGRYEEAERYGEISEDAATDDDVVSQVLAKGTLAKLVARRGDRLRAEEFANGAVALAEQTDFLMLRGDALYDRSDTMTILGSPEAAVEDLDRAVAVYGRKGVRVPADAARRSQESLAILLSAGSS